MHGNMNVKAHWCIYFLSIWKCNISSRHRSFPTLLICSDNKQWPHQQSSQRFDARHPFFERTLDTHCLTVKPNPFFTLYSFPLKTSVHSNPEAWKFLSWSNQISCKSVQWLPNSSVQTGRRDGQTDVTKPIVGFRNFADSPKNDNIFGGY